MSSSPDLAGRMMGRYRLSSLLGRGGMASVWRAADTLGGPDVAVKVLDAGLAGEPDARRRLRHEAEAAALLDHPAIVPVHDYGEENGHAFLSMTLIEGETLASRAARALLPIEEARRIVLALADAVGYAHAHGVLHRDLSPRNVMLTADGRVFLLDFGLALVAGLSRVTRPGSAIGTRHYMAPEQLLAAGADARSDLYALAVIFYELLTGNPPHRGDHVERLLYAKQNEPAHPVHELRPEAGTRYDEFFRRALAAELQDRFADAEAFSRALSEPAVPAPERAPGGAWEHVLADRRDVVYVGVPAFAVDGDAPATAAALAGELATALRRRLSKLSRLHVLMVGEPLDWNADARAWARGHGAQLLLLCRLRVRGARVRLDCTLLDPERGAALAGDVLDGPVEDAFGLEDRLVETARGLFPVLGDAVRADASTQDMRLADEHQAQALRYLQRHDHQPSVDYAIALLERLADRENAPASISAALGRAYLAKLRLTKQHAWEARAATSIERALKRDDGSIMVRLAHADLLAQRGEFARSQGLYEEALAADPGLFDAWLGLARLQLAHGRYDEAERTCRHVIRLRPRDWRGYATLGLSFFRRGQHDRALAPWKHVLRLSPENVRGALNVAGAYFEMGRFPEAVRAYERAIAIEPNAEGYSCLGAALFAAGRHEEALRALERATVLNPADPIPWGNLGLATIVHGKDDVRGREYVTRAAGLMREHLRLRPGDATGWAWLGNWLQTIHRSDEARDAIDRALELEPEEPHILVHAARVSVQAGRREEAIERLERAVAHGASTVRFPEDRDFMELADDPRYRALLAPAASAAGDGRGR